MWKRILPAAVALTFLVQPAIGGAPAGDPAESVNAFALDLYARLGKDDGNLFFSPASIAYALAMTRTGAEGETAAQMDRVLHLSPNDPDMPADFGRLMATLNDEDSGVTLSLANRLFGEESFRFRGSFLTGLERHFDAELEAMDFRNSAEESRIHINDWVAARTEDRIRDLLPGGSLTSATRLVLVNAIYFLGNWQTTFPADATVEGPFNSAGGEARNVPLMNLTGHFRYAEESGLQVLALPYDGGNYDMVILLPAPGAGLAALETRLSSDDLARWLATPQSREVRVTLPRMKLAGEASLGRVLAGMGMPLAFSRQANFGGMADGGELAIDEVVHKAWIEVDEEGTEAAAATGVIMRTTSVSPDQPAVFRADRPFLFAIRHRQSGAILFMGRFSEPE